MIQAVRDVSFEVKRGETVGLVGESGCGKSTIAFGIVGFLGQNGEISGGGVSFESTELIGRSEEALKKIRGNRIAMVYQDPMQALNPSMRVGKQLAEVLTCHHRISHEEAWERSIQMLKRVYMPDSKDVMQRYPHQISGGQQQRIVIAMALLNNPSLLIMDEPTTALDVTVEATVLDMIDDLKRDYDAGIIFISHNLGVIARVCDKVCVMYAGDIVENGSVREIFHRPRHPYTKGLMASVPKLGENKSDSFLEPIRGQVPPPSERPRDACVFGSRCDYVTNRCQTAHPDFEEVSSGHMVRCVYAREIERREKTVTNNNEPKARLIKKSRGEGKILLTCDNLKVFYPHKSKSLLSLIGLGAKKMVKAVDNVSLRIKEGRTVGIVGESGCGKSSLVKAIIGLESVTGGKAEFLGLDITKPVLDRDLILIKEIQMVFQNPDSTLNPSYSVGWQIARSSRKFNTVTKNQVKDEVLRMLKAVRLNEQYYDRFPRQLSGGEKQRIGIARALASRPDLVLCDEPVSALDVSVQAAVINLLLEIQKSFNTTMLFVAHDLSVIRFFCDEVAVMYLGQVAEFGPAESIYKPPHHPYTEALLSAVPIPDPDATKKKIRLSGDVPSAVNPPAGCRFHTRCPRRKSMLPDEGMVCSNRDPPLREVTPGHQIFCHIELDELRQLDSILQ